MRALRDTVMSLYEVSEVVPGQSMTLRDLLRDVAPVTVREHGATQTLVNWDKIAARVVDVNGRHGISGALLPFSAEGAVRVVDAFSRLADETQDTAELDPSDRDALLGASGPMFTNMWLLDCLGKAMPGSAPDMVNADGDDLVFHRIVFPLAKGVVGKKPDPKAERGTMAGTCQRQFLELAGTSDEEQEAASDQRQAGLRHDHG